ILCVVFVVTCCSAAWAQSDDRSQFAAVTGMGSSIRWDVAGPHAAVTLTVATPDGQVISKEFSAGNSPEFRLVDANGERLPDGQYVYEIRVTPIIGKEVKDKLKLSREKGNSDEVQRDFKRRGVLPSRAQVQSGSFTVTNGMVLVAGAASEGGRPGRAAVDQPAAPTAPAAAAPSGRTNFKILRHHPSFMVFDQVIPDDLIVQGSACVGLDCVNNENFGFDTIRVKENNTRIQFDDTSSSAGFATNNWQIRANDSASGGASFLGIVDQGATANSDTGTIVFAVDAGAAANSLRVGSNSKIGLRTATPALDIHANTSDTPAIRLEQNNSGGFSAQTWDIGANEANFFVRDLTGGSRLSFRIRPGAPTSSIDIAASGNVGINNSSPSTTLDVSGNIVLVGSESGATTRTSGTTKLSRLAMPPFTSTNTNVSLVVGATTNTENIVVIGGGAFGQSAATSVSFNTAATTTTDIGTERMRILSNGRVGIGTATPDQLFSVNGDASKVGGGSWQSFSDARLKNISGPFKSGLNAVMRLQPLRYEYKPNNPVGITPNGEHIGLAAQNVQQVIPEAVTANAQGYLMVNNDPIIWTMLNAIKEQQQEIQELKREVRRLRANNTRRRRR
ncbi:MAG TPA: tail fiber domain-containing protein, partial [Pyrinomonadaceae bacterium]|nr:tail fiber domain-containing protein [Pyrinomonadaceae bacterium]